MKRSGKSEPEEPATAVPCLVVQKVWTPADFDDDRRFVGDFHWFRHEERGRRSWIAVKPVDAASVCDAYARASQDLMSLIDRLYLLLQCEFSIGGASWFAVRPLADGQYLWANVWRAADVVPMGLSDDVQIEDLRRISNANEAGLRYFREAGRASTVKTKLLMLVIAAEALAGTGKTRSECQKCKKPFLCSNCEKAHSFAGTDKARLAEILTRDLHDRLYKDKKGEKAVRHRLVHGRMVPELDASELARSAYKAIRGYLWKHCGLEGNDDIVYAPRPSEGIEQMSLCFKLPEPFRFDQEGIQHVDWSGKLRLLEEEEEQRLSDCYPLIDPPPDL